MAHTDRYGGSWLTTTYEDVTRVARDPEHFSSRNVSVLPPAATESELLPVGLPPIQADPPVHTWSRRLLLPWFSNNRVAEYEICTRELCRELLDRFADSGSADAAADYAKQIPVRVIGKILGIPEDMSETFIEWVRSVLEFANDTPQRNKAQIESVSYFLAEIDTRRAGTGTVLISELLRSEVDGDAVPDEFVLGVVALTLIAGLDTTWSALGSMLWHLAGHPDDTRRLVEQPELLPTAIEEMLRAYAPVTMARIVADDVEVHGCPMKEGDRVILNFPAANRDPDAFPHADQVIIEQPSHRLRRRHPSLCRLQPRPDGAPRRPRGMARPNPELPVGGRPPGDVGRWPGSRTTSGAGRLPVKVRVDADKCQGHSRWFALAPELFEGR